MSRCPVLRWFRTHRLKSPVGLRLIRLILIGPRGVTISVWFLCLHPYRRTCRRPQWLRCALTVLSRQGQLVQWVCVVGTNLQGPPLHEWLRAMTMIVWLKFVLLSIRLTGIELVMLLLMHPRLLTLIDGAISGSEAEVCIVLRLSMVSPIGRQVVALNSTLAVMVHTLTGSVLNVLPLKGLRWLRTLPKTKLQFMTEFADVKDVVFTQWPLP